MSEPAQQPKGVSMPRGDDAHLGRRRWMIAEGYIPGYGHGPEPQLASHETVCILNAHNHDASIELWIYFADREPAGPYLAHVPARRTLHLRFDELTYPEPVPRDTDFASVITASVPVCVQHTRLDSRQAENALLSTVAYPAD